MRRKTNVHRRTWVKCDKYLKNWEMSIFANNAIQKVIKTKLVTNYTAYVRNKNKMIKMNSSVIVSIETMEIPNISQIS